MIEIVEGRARRDDEGVAGLEKGVVGLVVRDDVLGAAFSLGLPRGVDLRLPCPELLRRGPGMNIIDAETDPALLRPWFAARSWNAWRTVLKAIYALPMTAADHRRFHDLAERKPPDKPIKEAWIRAGRRSGKTLKAAEMATYAAAFRDYRQYLKPGEKAHVLHRSHADHQS